MNGRTGLVNALGLKNGLISFLTSGEMICSLWRHLIQVNTQNTPLPSCIRQSRKTDFFFKEAAGLKKIDFVNRLISRGALREVTLNSSLTPLYGHGWLFQWHYSDRKSVFWCRSNASTSRNVIQWHNREVLISRRWENYAVIDPFAKKQGNRQNVTEA